MTGTVYLTPFQLLTHGPHHIITTSRRVTCYDIALRPLEWHLDVYDHYYLTRYHPFILDTRSKGGEALGTFLPVIATQTCMRPRIAEILEDPCVGKGGGPRGPYNISVLHTIRHAV